MIALAQMWALPGSRWCTQHTDEYFPFAIVSEAVDTAFGSGTGMGPWNAQLNGSMTNSQTSITLTSTLASPPGGYSVGDPVSAFPDNYLQSWAIGDYLTVDGEVMLLTGGSNPTWTVSRAQGGTSAASHSNGANALATCTSQGNALTYSGGYLWWDFLASPDGTNTADWQIQFGSHPVSRGNYRVDSGWPWRAGAPTNHATWGQAPTNQVTAEVTFGGQYANGSGNSFQKHPAMASGGADANFFDQNYFVGTSLWGASNSTLTTNITGSLYQYHYETSTNYAQAPQILIARKNFPTVVKTQGRSFQDISGPGSVISGSSAYNYQYCVANANGECVAGSTTGNIYFNDPTLNASVGCSGGENPTLDQDICIGNWWPNGVGANQYAIVNDTTGGASYRKLTTLFGGFEGISTNVKLTFDGNWAMYFVPPPSGVGLPNGSTSIYAIKVPPIPSNDGIDRSTFIPATVSVTAPTGLGVATARLKFGYAENGGASPYYPTSRQDPGVVVGSSVNLTTPFYFASEAYTPATCATTCSFVIPVYPLHTAYYNVEFLNGNNAVVASSSGVAMENAVVSLGGSSPPPPPTPPTITSGSPLPGGSTGVSYSYQFTATGTTPITWSGTGLPSWASLSSGGLLTGFPNVAAVSSLSITATNSGGSAGPVTFSLTITNSSTPPTITSTSPLPAGSVAIPYSYQFTATGTAPISWAGSGLPSWASLGSMGLLTGTPNIGGTSTFNISATNAGGIAGPLSFSLSVNSLTCDVNHDGVVNILDVANSDQYGSGDDCLAQII